MKSVNAQFRADAIAALESADDALRLVIEELSEVRPRCSVSGAMNTAKAERIRLGRWLAGWRSEP